MHLQLEIPTKFNHREIKKKELKAKTNLQASNKNNRKRNKLKSKRFSNRNKKRVRRKKMSKLINKRVANFFPINTRIVLLKLF